MLEDLVVQYCAPTLAGIKTGSLFSCPFTSYDTLKANIRQMNRALVPKGVCVLPLRLWQDRALIYLFRPERLKQDLSCAEAACLLRSAGYPCTKPERCIIRLMQRLQGRRTFPMKSGCFSGIHRKMCVDLLRIRPRILNAWAAGRSMAMKTQQKSALHNMIRIRIFIAGLCTMGKRSPSSRYLFEKQGMPVIFSDPTCCKRADNLLQPAKAIRIQSFRRHVVMDLKKSAYFQSLPEPIRQSIMESKMQDGINFQNEDELRRFASQYFPAGKKHNRSLH